MSMIKTVFGELSFDTGWKTKTAITLFTKSYDVVVKAKAYFEKDGITKEQEDAFTDFLENKSKRLKKAEELLLSYAKGTFGNRFKPRLVLFNRDGGYAILFDDGEDEDGGVAVTLLPEECVISQDEYL